MESTALSVFPVNENKRVVSHFSAISGLEIEDRHVIETIAKRFQEIHKKSIFSSKTLPSRVLLKFFKIDQVSLASLRKINISTHRIKRISIDLVSKNVAVELKRGEPSKQPLTIKKRFPALAIDTELLKQTITSFLKDNAKMVRDEDKRLIRAVLECILRWTWNTVAPEVSCKLVGDNYNFSIKGIQNISLSQLEALCDLGDYVQELNVNLNQKMVHFLVLRTSSYIHDSQVKRRKINA